MGRILIGNVRNPLADNLTTAENAKYALDAHQGKVLDEKKIDKTSIVNNSTTTTTGTVLDGRMGKTLQNGIDELNSNLNEPKTRTIEGAYVNMQVTTFGKFVWVRIAGYPKNTMKQGQEYTLFRPTTNTPMYGVYRRININPTAGFVFQMSSVDAETSITPFGGDLTSTSGINVSECYIMK